MIDRRLIVHLLPLALLIVVAELGPVLAPYDPRAPLGGSLAAPSMQHLLGTTSIGQDVLSRILWGSQHSVGVAATVTVGALTLGTTAGATAGLIGGWADKLLDRVVDLTLALPRLPLLVLIASFSPGGALTVIVVLIALGWAGVARVVRAQTLALKASRYLHISAAMGGGRSYVLRRHVIPALLPVVAIQGVTVASGAILLEATLAFLGLAPSGAISWGADLNRTLTEPGVLLSQAWLWWALPTGLAVVATCGAVLFAGTALDSRRRPRTSRIAAVPA